MSNYKKGQKVKAYINGKPEQCVFQGESQNGKRVLVTFENMQYETDLVKKKSKASKPDGATPEPEKPEEKDK